MALTADIFDDRERWGAPLSASIVFHAILALVVVGWAWVAVHRGSQSWGGPGAGAGSITVTAVSSIPLPPQEQAPTENVLATQSKGLSQSLPKQVEKAPEDAIPIAGKTARQPKKQPERATTTAKQPEPQQPLPTNQVPYGQGGPANSVQFNMGSGTGGLTVEGSGDFQGVYDWYVQAMRRKIAQTWSFYQAGSGVPKGSRVTVSFEIDRSGRPSKISVSQPSGYATLDQSALQTLQRVDSFGPLPDSYRGSSVLVSFYFEAQ